MRLLPTSLCAIVCLVLALNEPAVPVGSGEPQPSATAARPVDGALLRQQPGCFVPNLGQWDHAARFVHRSGPMTLSLLERGWVVDLVERTAEMRAARSGRTAVSGPASVPRKARAVALEMTFEGAAPAPATSGEGRLPGHYNYFLGADARRWRTDVPRYASVLYTDLYPGIDLRLREEQGRPEYDLLVQPGADLAQVSVRVTGGRGLSIRADGSLAIDTGLEPLVQTVPRSWQVDADGREREVTCRFVLLGPDRFGFEAEDWSEDTELTIDPGLVWSTYFGGTGEDTAVGSEVDPSGIVTLAGISDSMNLPSTRGVYDATFNGVWDGFVTRLDPRRSGAAQLLYTTYLGGSADDGCHGLGVDADGVVTVVGVTSSSDYPTTAGAFDPTRNGPGNTYDLLVSRLDPRRSGVAQLVYSTYLGGAFSESTPRMHVDAAGIITVSATTSSSDFPTTSNAFDRIYNGQDSIVISRLDPTKNGAAQLVYSTYLAAGGGFQRVTVDAGGVVTVVGTWHMRGAPFPTTSDAFDSVLNGLEDGYLCRLDPSRLGSAQVVYCTLLGGSGWDSVGSVTIDPAGMVTLVGATASSDFPVTGGALQPMYGGGPLDGFITRLDLTRKGSAQLVYSTYLGGTGYDVVSIGRAGIDGQVTLTGQTTSPGFPTTPGAFDTTYGGGAGDVFLCRVDPRRSGRAQLVYSTFFGGNGIDAPLGFQVDPAGVVSVAGVTWSTDLPTTMGAFSRALNGGANDCFVARLNIDSTLYADGYEVPIAAGGTQALTIEAGLQNAFRPYWIFGSMSGTSPGINLLGVDIPLNPDAYTTVAMGAANSAVFAGFKGVLDASGNATARLNVPANLPVPSGLTLHHAYLVYDTAGRIYMASNAVPVRLK